MTPGLTTSPRYFSQGLSVLPFMRSRKLKCLLVSFLLPLLESCSAVRLDLAWVVGGGKGGGGGEVYSDRDKSALFRVNFDLVDLEADHLCLIKLFQGQTVFPLKGLMYTVVAKECISECDYLDLSFIKDIRGR